MKYTPKSSQRKIVENELEIQVLKISNTLMFLRLVGYTKLTACKLPLSLYIYIYMQSILYIFHLLALFFIVSHLMPTSHRNRFQGWCFSCRKVI